MRQKRTAYSIVRRRRRALSLLKKGLSLNEVACRIGCHASSVMRWRDDQGKKGDEVFKVHQSSGRPPKLSSRQIQGLEKLLRKGALSFGHFNNIWTTSGIARLIEEEFGIRYNRGHISRLMKRMGWIYEMPRHLAIKHGKKIIRRRRRKEWPRLRIEPHGWIPKDMADLPSHDD